MNGVGIVCPRGLVKLPKITVCGSAIAFARLAAGEGSGLDKTEPSCRSDYERFRRIPSFPPRSPGVRRPITPRFTSRLVPSVLDDWVIQRFVKDEETGKMVIGASS